MRFYCAVFKWFPFVNQVFIFQVNPETGLIDYDELEKTSKLFRPKLIIAGVSCYSRNLDYARFRKIADACGAYLMADMAHIAGEIIDKS